jgi:hypothetical protein
MAVQEIIKYNYKNIFSLSTVTFEKACTIDHSVQQNAYSIYWIQEGQGTYNIDFEKYDFKDNVLFFLSPGQVFTVDSEQIKTAYKLTFVRDFYCIQTHDKEVATTRNCTIRYVASLSKTIYDLCCACTIRKLCY